MGSRESISLLSPGKVFRLLLWIPVLTACSGAPSRGPASAMDASVPITQVYFFGGFDSNASQMECWLSGATRAAPDTFRFQAYPYPAGAGSDAGSVLLAGRTLTAQVAREMRQDLMSDPLRQVVVAGHSSGSALATETVRQALLELTDPAQRARIELVDLDGFTPPSEIRHRVKTNCWAAQQEKSGLKSFNAGADGHCENVFTYRDEHCATQWCLHFTLVNRSTPAALGASDFARQGYQGCETNLDWLLPPTK